VYFESLIWNINNFTRKEYITCSYHAWRRPEISFDWL